MVLQILINGGRTMKLKNIIAISATSVALSGAALVSAQVNSRSSKYPKSRCSSYEGS